MPRFPMNLGPEDQVVHRRWVVRVFSLYCVLLLAAVAIDFATRSTANVTVTAGIRTDGPTQKLRPPSRPSSVSLSSVNR